MLAAESVNKSQVKESCMAASNISSRPSCLLWVYCFHICLKEVFWEALTSCTTCFFPATRVLLQNDETPAIGPKQQLIFFAPTFLNTLPSPKLIDCKGSEYVSKHRASFKRTTEHLRLFSCGPKHSPQGATVTKGAIPVTKSLGSIAEGLVPNKQLGS